ncbi:hypothetical protein TSAR_014420 [Trichomalopsis sarcophagae]|uniref:CLIP domain-containing serine protease n=1 Tax=Trichomalopsis sarcophagae TaxID=543379 RepID=A0A232EYB2_9HYME|nr:hypothetical protein TSAR_014420 [Trichomalopsis sarcophagae]
MILLLTIVLCTFHQFTVTTAFADCRSESFRGTECVKITSCEETFDYIKELHSTNLVLHYRYMIGYMRSITCGFDGNVPKVCCSIRNPYNAKIVKRMALFDSTGIIFPNEPALANTPDSPTKTDTVPTTKILSSETTKADSSETTKADSETTVEADLETTTEAESTTQVDTGSNDDSGSKESSESKEDPSALPTVCGNFIWSKNLNKDDHPTDLGDFPWLALLEYNTTTGTQIGCGGVLISNRYVLTSGHCVDPSLNLTSVRLGEHDLNMDPDCSYEGPDVTMRYCADKTVVVTVEKQIPHENYSFVQDSKDSGSKPYDIALIRLTKAVSSDYVKPICLPGETAVIKDRFLSAGWGAAPNNTYLRSSVKRMARMIGVAEEDCNEKYEKQLQDDMLCAKSQSLQTACVGDSGGPLMSIDLKSRMTVEGLFSPIHKEFCLIGGVPGTYTNVRKYTDWIKANM